MSVSPPIAGKTSLLKETANAVTDNYPDMYLIILLIDERPEEVTDIRESIQGEHVEVIILLLMNHLNITSRLLRWFLSVRSVLLSISRMLWFY